MKMFNLKFACLFILISFISCNDDSSSEKSYTGKKLFRIYEYVTDDNWNDWGGNELEYDKQGRLVKVWRYYEGIKGEDGKVVVFDYSGNTVIMRYRGSESIFTIDQNGYAVSCVSGNDDYKFTYSDEGYLTEIEYDTSSGTMYYKYFWENGNMIKYNFLKADGLSESTEFQYDDRDNTYSLMPKYMKFGWKQSWFEPYNDLLEWAYYAGLLGKSTKNLAKSFEYKYPYEKTDTITYCHEVGWTKEEGMEKGYSFPVYEIK